MPGLAKIASRLRKPPSPPRAFTGFAPHVDKKPDDDHKGEDIPGETDIIGQSFGMEYRDAEGVLSKRRITIRKLAYSADHNLLMKCFCWERVDARTFRADRIQTLYRLSTGEIIESPEHFLEQYARPLPPENFAARLLKQTQPGLRVLVYLSRCDGEELLEERDAMWWFVAQRAKGAEFTWEPFRDFVSAQHPDMHLTGHALRQAASDPDEARCLLKAAAMLVAADGEINADEAKACLEMEQILGVDD